VHLFDGYGTWNGSDGGKLADEDKDFFVAHQKILLFGGKITFLAGK
jgi:hypothetical protein